MRKPEHPVNELILNRWSPRAMKPGLTKKDLMSLFEAARWAPSSYNNQPWRFVYALKGTEHWDNMFSFLVPFNQTWTKNAGALIVVVSLMTFEKDGKASRTHSYDTGAAVENLALQAYHMGLAVHQMEGFDLQKAREGLNIPLGYAIEVMVAVGKIGDKNELPESLKGRETPSGRKKVSEIAFEGTWPE